MASMAIAGTASAQSTVTLFGVVDAAISGTYNKSKDNNVPTLANPSYVNRGSVTVSKTELRHSGTSTSRLGFRGTEDLGGGLAASFWLEAPITNDDGANGIATFARRSTVSLSGGFGEIRLGRDYTPTFWNDSIADPWTQIGSGASLMLSAGAAAPGSVYNANGNYARASNTVGYFLPPTLGGVYGQFMYGLPENVKYAPGTTTPPGVNAAGAVNAGAVAPSRVGRYVGGRLGYANGALDVAVAYAESTLADNYYAGTTDSVKIMNAMAIYDFGVVKLSGELSRQRYVRDYAVMPATGGITRIDVNGYLVSAQVPVGPGLIRVAYSHLKYDLDLPGVADPTAGKLALGYIYNLSKRTALYATVARVNNKNGASRVVNPPAFISNATYTPDTSTAYDVGIRTAF